MSYEDEEILWLDQPIQWFEKTSGWDRMIKANLAIYINESNGTFCVMKNRWGYTFNNIPLDYLDEFLEDPEFNWKHYFKLYEPRVVKT